MNALETYFAESGDSLGKIADRLGFARSTLTRPVKGERRCNTDIAMAVEKATDGKVTATEFLSICVEASRQYQARSAEAAAAEPEGAST